MLFFQDGITGPGSYRFPCPTNFGKIFLHLFSSAVGLDVNCVLDGNQAAQPSTFVPSSKKAPPAVNKSSQNKRQKNIRDFSDPQKSKTVEGPCCNNSGKTSASRARPVLSNSKAGKRSQERVSSVPKSLPSTARRGEAVRGVTTHRPAPTFPEESIRVTPQRSVYSQNRFSQPSTVRADRCHNDDIQLSVRRENRQPPREPVHTPAMQTPIHHEDSSNKRSLPTSWNQTRRKQQRSQQRAFASKRDNPFAHFQHDPNDAESYLEGLSSQSQSQSRFQTSLIPQSKLNHLHKYANTVAQPHRNAQHTSSFGRQRVDRQRRRNGGHQAMSNQELLQRKAEESQALVEARRWPQPSSEVYSPEYSGAPARGNSYPNYEHPVAFGPEEVGMNSSWQHGHQTSMFQRPFDQQNYPTFEQTDSYAIPITHPYQSPMQEEVRGGEMVWHSSVGRPTGSSFIAGNEYSLLPEQQQQQQAPGSQQIYPPDEYQIGWSQQPDEESQFRDVFF